MRYQILVFLVILLFTSPGLIYLSSTEPSQNVKMTVDTTNPIFHRNGLAWNKTATPFLTKVIPNSQSGLSPYSVNSIRKAYNLTKFYNESLCGQGYTVAIIDAFGDPDIQYDLRSFDSLYGLPSANISFYYPYGDPQKTNSSWSLETATDVEWLHAIAPRAHIDLVILPNAAVGYLQGGVNYTVSNISGVNEISMSWGIPESCISAGLIDSYKTAFSKAQSEGINVFAASGDQGAYDGKKSLTVNFPSSDPNLTAVGGTTLSLSNGVYTQQAWDFSGGGYSQYFNEPSYQKSAGISSSSRGGPDISAIANPNSGGVYVLSRGRPNIIGGTSLATPITAGSFLLIDQYLNGSLKYINNRLYSLVNTSAYGKAIIPITSGNNGFYSAKYGWNPVTGLGTYNAMAMAKTFKQMTSFYGYRENIGYITSSNFSIKETLGLNYTKPSSIGYRFEQGIVISNGSNLIFSGILQSGGSTYIYFKAGSYIYREIYNIPNFKNIQVSIFVNVSSLVFSLNGNRVQIQIFPGNLYGSEAGFYVGTTSRNFIPESMENGTVTGLNLSQNGVSESSLISGFIKVPINSQKFSIVQINNLSDGFSFKYSKKPSGDYGNISLNPLLTMSTSNGGRIFIHYNRSFTYTVNGLAMTGSNFSVSPGEKINLKVYHSTSDFEFDLVLPKYILRHIIVNYSADSYFTANFTSTYDYLYNSIITNDSELFTLGNFSNLTLNAFGFYSYRKEVSNTNITAYMDERPVNLSIQISPINANIYFSNGSLLYDRNGTAIYSVIPQSVDYNFSVTGGDYLPFKGNLSLIPGQNVTYVPIALMGSGAGYFLNGTVANEIYKVDYNAVIPIRNALVTNSVTKAYSDQFGCYSIWLPAGFNQIKSNSTDFYTSYNNLTIRTSQSNYCILLKPNLVNLDVIQPELTVDRLLPFMFFGVFISWSTNFQNRGVQYYEIYYKEAGTTNWTTVKESASSNDIAILTGIFPGKSYEFKVKAKLTGGITVNSNIVATSYSSPIILFLSVLIYVGLGLVVYSLYSFEKRRKKRKQMQKQFKEWET